MPASTITAFEVARRLRMSQQTFRNKRRKLETEHGFPPKLPGVNAWSEPAVNRWIETNGESYQPKSDPRATRERLETTVQVSADALAREFERGAA